MPKHLYKFYSCESSFLIDSLNSAIYENKYWFSTADNLNDLSEINISIPTVDDEEFIHKQKRVVKGLTAGPFRDQFLASQRNMLSPFGVDVEHLDFVSAPDWTNLDPKQKLIVDRILFHSVRENTSVFSFTKSWDHELLWAYYGSNHSGLCVKYAIDSSRYVEGTPGLSDVIYTTMPPKFDFYGIQESILLRSLLSEGPFKLEDELTKVFCSKRTAWRHEDEVRALRHTTDGYALCPHIKPVAIILGLRSDDKLYRKIVKVISGLPVYKMYFNHITQRFSNSITENGAFRNYHYAQEPSSDEPDYF